MPTLLVFPNSLKLLACRNLSCWVYQTENVVEDVVAALAVWRELEGLRVAHWSPLLLDQQGTSDNDQDATAVVAGLRIESSNLVFDSLEWELLSYRSATRDIGGSGIAYGELCGDGGASLCWVALECEHGLIPLFCSIVSIALAIAALFVPQLLSYLRPGGSLQRIRACGRLERGTWRWART